MQVKEVKPNWKLTWQFMPTLRNLNVTLVNMNLFKIEHLGTALQIKDQPHCQKVPGQKKRLLRIITFSKPTRQVVCPFFI